MRIEQTIFLGRVFVMRIEQMMLMPFARYAVEKYQVLPASDHKPRRVGMQFGCCWCRQWLSTSKAQLARHM